MDRRTLVLAGLATVAGAALSGPAGARRRPPRQAAGSTAAARRRGGGLTARHAHTRIVTRTVTSTVPLSIPAGGPGVTKGAASPYPSIIRVRGLTQGRIVEVRVTLNGLTHSDPNDLDIMVVAPGNVGVILLSDAGQTSDVSGITLTFDQQAPGVPLTPLTSGTYQPLNNRINPDAFPAPAPQGVTGHFLTRFTARNPNGAWRLFVVDNDGGDRGSLAGWTLQIRARVRVPHQRRRRRARRPHGRANP